MPHKVESWMEAVSDEWFGEMEGPALLDMKRGLAEIIAKHAPSSPLDECEASVMAWGTECFGANHMADQKVRALRLLEEAIEFAQSVDAPVEQCNKLVEYVYSRPKGVPLQELGGVGVGWVAAASALGVSALETLRIEIKRVLSKPRTHFTQRNQNKLDAGFTGSGARAVKTTFTNKSKRIWSEEEARLMVNAALAKLIDDAGGLISISVSDMFRVAPMGTLAMALSDDDKILTLARIKKDS